jgi:hypothetical protein
MRAVKRLLSWWCPAALPGTMLATTCGQECEHTTLDAIHDIYTTPDTAIVMITSWNDAKE